MMQMITPPDTIPADWAAPLVILAWGGLMVILVVEHLKRQKGSK